MSLTVDQKAEIRSRIIAIEAALLAEIGESGVVVCTCDGYDGSRTIEVDFRIPVRINLEAETKGSTWNPWTDPDCRIVVIVCGGTSRQNRFTVKKGDKVDAKKVVGRFIEKINETLEKDRQYAARHLQSKCENESLADAVAWSGFHRVSGASSSVRDGLFEIKMVTRDPEQLRTWMAAITKGAGHSTPESGGSGSRV